MKRLRRLVLSLLLVVALGATAYSGGISALPFSAVTLDAVFGSAIGAMLCRASSGWSLVAAGSATQVLTVPSGGGCPAWATPASGGNVSSTGTPASGQIALFTNATTLQGANLLPVSAGGTGLSTASPNQFLAGPVSGSSTAAPGFRALVPADLPGVISPGGRLTLMSGQPVLQAAVSAATTVLYTPYTSNFVPVWNGSAFVTATFAEYGQALTDTTYSPAAAVAGACYDDFVWNNSGTVRATRGPSWAAGATAGSTTARGAGAGSTALTRVNGVLVNQYAVANGPAAGFGTFVGTFCTDAGGATVSWSIGGTAAGGVAANLNVWNAYNRRTVAARVLDTNQPYAVNTSGNYRNYANSATMRINFVSGLAEDGVAFQARTNVTVGSAAYHLAASLNGTAVADEYLYNVTASGLPLTLTDSISGTLGANALQLIESSSASVTVNSNGTNSFTLQQAM